MDKKKLYNSKEIVDILWNKFNILAYQAFMNEDGSIEYLIPYSYRNNVEIRGRHKRMTKEEFNE